MNTIIQSINIDEYQKSDLDQAAKILKSGGLVAFPTETVYGLGANALDETAARRIYEAKGRPSDNPLIVHIAERADMQKLACEIPLEAYKLAEVFWPGPLTIILKKNSQVPYSTTGGLDTVGLRLPANKIARDLIELSGVFIAAPSANLSGKPSPTKAEHVVEDLTGKVEMIINGGKSTLGLESTIVDLTGEKSFILRPGCITKAMLANVIGDIEYDPAILQKPEDDVKPKAPGMKYRHYAPEGIITIYEGNTQAVIAVINNKAASIIAEGKTVGIIATDETRACYEHGIVKSIGSRQDEASIAAGLYEILRDFDHNHTEYILTESYADNSLGHAIMNRLLKAAGYRIEQV